MKYLNSVFIFATILLIFLCCVDVKGKTEEEKPEPGMIESLASEECDEKMKPIFKKMQLDKKKFDYQPFCKSMKKEIFDSCEAAVLRVCEKCKWKSVKVACKAYLPDLLCD